LGNLLLVFGILILFGCGASNLLSEQASIPSLEISDAKTSEEPFFLADYAAEKRSIPLESTPKSLISYVNDFAFGEDYIYVLNPGGESAIRQFEWEGRYIRRIGTSGTPYLLVPPTMSYLPKWRFGLGKVKMLAHFARNTPWQMCRLLPPSIRYSIDTMENATYIFMTNKA
jgi:hypothetical protein